MIKKKIIQVGGNSWGIILPKPIMDALSINPVLDYLGLEIEPDGIKLKKLERED